MSPLTKSNFEKGSVGKAARLQRLKLVVAYDGALFRGWQSQTGGDTIQDHLQAAFQKICAQKIGVHGAGRTDAGVHALAQIAHVEVDPKRLPLEQWTRALNAHLPQQIRVMRCSRVSAGFHARFSAKEKLYTYRIWNDAILPPLELGRCWHIPAKLDLERIREAAALLTGTHDFAAFAANRGTPVADTTRTIFDIGIRTRGPLITISFRGDGFLYKMVRLLTGSMIRCAQHRGELAWLSSLLANETKTSFAAPAEGLCLTRIFY